MLLKARSATDPVNLHCLIDQLVNFKFVKFTPKFLKKMKDKFPELLKLVQEMIFDFKGDAIEGESKSFHNRLKEKARCASQRVFQSNLEEHL